MLDEQIPITFVRPRRVAEHGPEPRQIGLDGRVNLDDGHARSSRAERPHALRIAPRRRFEVTPKRRYALVRVPAPVANEARSVRLA